MICEICGKTFDRRIYCGEYSDCCSGECFRKKFWNNIVEEKDEHIVIDEVCYAIADSPVNGFYGCGGRKFKIKMLDTGKIVETNNLWCQGDVPDEYKSLLPNTAEFVREKRR